MMLCFGTLKATEIKNRSGEVPHPDFGYKLIENSIYVIDCLLKDNIDEQSILEWVKKFTKGANVQYCSISIEKDYKETFIVFRRFTDSEFYLIKVKPS